MGQSLLIDINSGWYKHKTEVNDGLKTKNYLQVKGALNALNALLPHEYRVIVDDDLYRIKAHGNMIIECRNCTETVPDPEDKEKTIDRPTQIDRSGIRVLNILLDSLQQVAYNKKYDDFWYCPKCNYLNRLSDSKIKKTELQKPFYLQTVPEPPKQQVGISGRNIFDYEFGEWARNFLAELNASAQRFRKEYKSQDNEIDDFEDAGNFEDDELID